jgi:hypothetical protein
MGLVGHPADAQFIGDILEFRRQTRQEALREAAKVALRYRDEARQQDLSGGYASTLIAKELDRLASEGA